MSKVHQVHGKYRERLLGIIAELLRDPDPHRIKDTAERYGVSREKIRRDLNYLIEKLNKVNQKEYILRGRGYYAGNAVRQLPIYPLKFGCICFSPCAKCSLC